MDLLHAVVHHKTFGQGKVMDVDNDVISISFSKPYGKRKFIFPTAFYQHLTLADGSLNTEMAEFLKQNNILIEAKQQCVERANRIAQFRASSVEKAIRSPKSKKTK